MKKTTNTNLTIEERANMTAQQANLRIENGENIDPREEIIVGDDTFESIFAEVDSKLAVAFGEHRVHLAPIDRKNDVEKSVKIVKNGVITETDPYIRLRFIDDETGKLLDLASKREHDNGYHYSARLYAWGIDGLRTNVNREYAGIAATMGTSTLLDFLSKHSISIWVSWNAKYMMQVLDYFDREAWEAYKAEQAKVGTKSRKASQPRRPVENRATR